MPRYNRNSGKAWTANDVERLAQLAQQNTPTRIISLKLGRTPAAVSTRASQEKISLQPTNQAPYNRRKRG